jgi:predicted alpha/beta hydrolase family esterase
MAAHAVDAFRVLVAPGLHNSGPEHWQSRWQRLFPAFERVEQDDWEAPDLARWSARVDDLRQARQANPPDQPDQPGAGAAARPLLIIAHSFGCLATVHSVARDPAGVAGVLLVAPADPDKFNVAAQLPQQALPCPSIMIGSTNDPWMAAPRAAQWAERWHSHFVDGGALGHINTESGLGDWPHGLEMLYFLIDKAQNRARETTQGGFA